MPKQKLTKKALLDVLNISMQGDGGQYVGGNITIKNLIKFIEENFEDDPT